MLLEVIPRARNVGIRFGVLFRLAVLPSAHVSAKKRKGRAKSRSGRPRGESKISLRKNKKKKKRERERRLPKNGDDYEAISEYANADFYIENVNKFQKILIIDSAIFLNVRIKD